MKKALIDILFIAFLLSGLVLTDNRVDFSFDRRFFENQIENQREYTSNLIKRQRLARLKFEEYCEPHGQILQRICPPLEQCLPNPIQVQQRVLREYLEDERTAHQFLHSFSRVKRFIFFKSNIKSNEKFVNERRQKALNLYEHYCESTDRLPRSCPAIDRCLCNDCNR